MLFRSSENCFHCHGPDERQRKGKLRLDRRESILSLAAPGKLPPVAPGKRAGSELMRRVLANSPEDRMPPPESNRQLTSAQIEILRRWIDEGATWGEHWAYEPIVRPEPPRPENVRWARNPIDRFVLSRLENERLSPSPVASKETLIRRLTLEIGRAHV